MAGNVKIETPFTLGGDFEGQNLNIQPDEQLKQSRPSVSTPVMNPVSPNGGGSGSNIPGPQGEKGEKGDTGEKGEKGDTGAAGQNGTNGKSIEFAWDTATPGIIKLGVRLTGDTNYVWSPNIKGEQGLQGATGATGATGPQGPKGDTGETGSTGPQGLQGEAGVAAVPEHIQITLPSNSTVQGRCDNAISGSDYPEGWTLSSSTNPADLKIVHTLEGKKCALCFIYSVSGGVETILLNNAAFTFIKNLVDGSVEIGGLATISTQIKIYLIFM